MQTAEAKRAERRARQRNAIRADILAAARRVAERDGARDLSLRSVAAETGFAPAALYVYFRSKDELLLALGAEDLGAIARTIRETKRAPGADRTAIDAVLDLLIRSETLAAALAALREAPRGSDAERLFNGRLIVALSELSAATGESLDKRESQIDTVLLASTLAGLAMLARSGRLQALGFDAQEMVQRLAERLHA
jgi:AcrR family transcriptional regulator